MWTRLKRPLAGAAVMLAVAVPVAVALFLILDSSDTAPDVRTPAVDVPTPTPSPTGPVTPPVEPDAAEPPSEPTPAVEAEPGLGFETAMALLEAAGGASELAMAVVVETHPWTVLTFDPLDPKRLLVGDVANDVVNQKLVAPELWVIADGLATETPIPGLVANGTQAGGMFQRDGTVLVDPGNGATLEGRLYTGFVILSSDGELLAEPDPASWQPCCPPLRVTV